MVLKPHPTRPDRHTVHKVLVFNPNSSTCQTDSFRPVLAAVKTKAPDSVALSYWTCPSGPAIIKTRADMQISAELCLPLLLKLAPDFDGFLAACYADHPIVRLLRAHVDGKPVVGIFDASVIAAVRLLAPEPSRSRFGIITTGAAYEPQLTRGVKSLLGLGQDGLTRRFAGVTASGIGLEDLTPPLGGNGSTEAARAKITEATRKMVRASEDDNDGGGVSVLCMGGVILAGMEAWVHEACEEELGTVRGRKVKVIDQLAAGLLTLDALLCHEQLWSVDYHEALK